MFSELDLHLGFLLAPSIHLSGTTNVDSTGIETEANWAEAGNFMAPSVFCVLARNTVGS